MKLKKFTKCTACGHKGWCIRVWGIDKNRPNEKLKPVYVCERCLEQDYRNEGEME